MENLSLQFSDCWRKECKKQNIRRGANIYILRKKPKLKRVKKPAQRAAEVGEE